MCGSCCVPCQVADSAGRLNESSGFYCILSFFVPCIPIFMLRQKIRRQYEIEGSTHNDAVSGNIFIVHGIYSRQNHKKE